MKRISRDLLLMAITLTFGLLSLASEHSSRFKDNKVIARAETIDHNNQKKAYLIHEAGRFLEKKDYENAKDIAEYIIFNLDSESEKANEILSIYRANEKR